MCNLNREAIYPTTQDCPGSGWVSAAARTSLLQTQHQLAKLPTECTPWSTQIQSRAWLASIPQTPSQEAFASVHGTTHSASQQPGNIQYCQWPQTQWKCNLAQIVGVIVAQYRCETKKVLTFLPAEVSLRTVEAMPICWWLPPPWGCSTGCNTNNAYML